MTSSLVTQRGSPSAKDDGPYVHVGVGKGKLAAPGELTSDSFKKYHYHDPAGVYWADLNGDGKDDYIWVGNNDVYGVALNEGVTEDVSKFHAYSEYPQPGACRRRGVRFADLNGDGMVSLHMVYLK
jgi:hypothetical protein